MPPLGRVKARPRQQIQLVEESGSGTWLGMPRAEGRPVGRRGRHVVQEEAGAQVGGLGFILGTIGSPLKGLVTVNRKAHKGLVRVQHSPVSPAFRASLSTHGIVSRDSFHKSLSAPDFLSSFSPGLLYGFGMNTN